MNSEYVRKICMALSALTVELNASNNINGQRLEVEKANERHLESIDQNLKSISLDLEGMNK